MREKERQHLEGKLHTLETRRDQVNAELARTRRHLHTLAQRERHERLCHLGALVELAGLADTDASLLLGGLCEMAKQLQDSGTADHWIPVGKAALCEHRRRPTPRSQTGVSAP